MKNENRKSVAQAVIGLDNTSGEKALDSGTANHVIKKKTQLTDLKRCIVQVALKHDSRIKAPHKKGRKLTESATGVNKKVLLFYAFCSKELALSTLPTLALTKA